MINAVRAEIGPDVPLFLRISATDWMPGGWTLEDSVELSRRAAGAGVDLIDCSSGGSAVGAKIPVGPGYPGPFLRSKSALKLDVLTGAVGVITRTEQANAIIESGEADLVLLARELLRDPYFPMHAAQHLGVAVKAPKQYLRAFHGSIRRS